MCAIILSNCLVPAEVPVLHLAEPAAGPVRTNPTLKTTQRSWAANPRPSPPTRPNAFQKLRRYCPTKRILKWALIGLLFMSINLPFLYLLVSYLHLSLPSATLIAATIGTLLRFLANDRFVFQPPSPTLARLKTYYTANALGLLVWYAVANSLPHFGVHYLISAILATACSVSLSLTNNFLWVWRKRSD